MKICFNEFDLCKREHFFNNCCISGLGFENLFKHFFSLDFKLINARSLKNKDKFLTLYLQENKDTIFCFTETWLDPSFESSLLVGDTNFIVVRCDRLKSKTKPKKTTKKVTRKTSKATTNHGGVCIFIPKHYPFTVRQTPPIPGIESVTVDIFFGPSSFSVTLSYVPPKLDIGKVRTYCEVVANIINNSVTPQHLLLGDFNVPDVCWDTVTATTLRSKTFIDFLKAYSLTNTIRTPTRQDNILDLVISHTPEKISNVSVEAPLTTSDHNIVNFSLSLENPPPSAPSYSFKSFKKANYFVMNLFFMQYSWHSLNSASIEAINSELFQVINHAISLFVKVVTPSSADRLPPNIKKMINYRNTIPLNSANVKKISLISKRILTLSSKARRQKENEILKNYGIKGMFNHLGKLLKNNNSIPALKQDDQTVFLDSDKASAFANNFLTYFHPSKSPEEIFAPDDIPFTPLTEFEVLEHLKSLPSKCNTSPDGIPYIILKKCAATLVKPITNLINLSLSQGAVPSLWKMSTVIPIFKNGEKHFPSNYRPISLNCSLSSIPQKIIIEHLSNFFKENNLLPSCQHGFTKGKNVTTQLLETFDFVTQKADINIPVDIIYFDVKKAFDRMKHHILFRKLKAANVPYFILSWIRAFLTDRKFRVKIGDSLSDLFDVNFGVPQGSKLGPLLFAFFIADLVTSCETPGVILKLFADDLKALSANLHLRNPPLYQFLRKLEVWVDENELEIAINKCNVLHCVPKKNSKISYFFKGVKLPNNQNSIRDLGLIVSHDLTWGEHIKTITKKALTRSFLLFKGLRSTSPKLLYHMYTTYVRPLVEFSTPVFNPTEKNLIYKLEKVQRVAIRNIFYRCKALREFSNEPYEAMLIRLGSLLNTKIETLENRRNKYDLSFLNDYLNGSLTFKLNLTKRDSKTRGAYQKIHIPKSKKEVRKSFFTVKATSRYTKLPRNIQYTSHKEFKNYLLTS